jgi:hypothetical protein
VDKLKIKTFQFFVAQHALLQEHSSKLKFSESGIESALRDEVRVLALLDYLPILKHEDMIRLHDRGKTVCDS